MESALLESPIIDGLRGRKISMPNSPPNHYGPTSPSSRRTKSSPPTQHSPPQPPSPPRLGLPRWISPRFLSPDAEENIRFIIELEPHIHAKTAMELLFSEDLAGTAICDDVRDLVRFVSKFFSVEVLESLQRTLDIWELRSLPETTIFHAARHVFNTFVVRCAAESSTGSTGSGSTGSTSNGNSSTPSGGNGGNSGQPSRSTNGAPDGSERNGPPEDQKSKNNTTPLSAPLPGDGFRNAARRTVKTEFGLSPPAPPKTKRPAIASHSNSAHTPGAALRFDIAFHNGSSLPAAFDDLTSSIAVLYHATRAHHLPNFLLQGVAPNTIDPKPNELHYRSAFYLSNTVANGASHVLHYQFHPQNKPDPLLVFSFVVNPRIIFGHEPYTRNLHFKTRLMQVPPNPLDVGHKIRYQEFCQFVRKNWTQSWYEEDREELDKFDFVVAPVCERPSDNSTRISRSLTNGGPNLVQVAACSCAARAYLNSTVIEIVQEDH
ncbi:hypothetical protein B0H19DRAFT_1266118 [Mycena capillaripes]|nr:hypothetical protein B0H19DRAFT_1266118 [Mycena capillaripes]